ncbi:MAG: hypothetical protein ACTSSH_13530 [Candidatus Heimdallarchaeota archaeon]
MLLVVSLPMIVMGIVYLVTISIANIWGWMFIGFGVILLVLITTLLVTISGTTGSRYNAEFDA